MCDFESWIHVLPAEIRMVVVNHLNYTDSQFKDYSNSLLEEVSLALAYPNLLGWPQLLSQKLANLPNFNKVELMRLLQLCNAASLVFKHHFILLTPKVANLQLDSLENRSIGEAVSESAYSVSNMYNEILQLCPNISSIHLISSRTYVFNSAHQQQLYEIFDHIAKNLDEIHLSLKVANTEVFDVLRNCLKYSKIQKLIFKGRMSSDCFVLLKEQKHIKSFLSDEIDAHVFLQLVHYWPYLEDLDISGIQLYSSARHICQALCICSNRLKTLKLTGVGSANFNACYSWLSDDDDQESFVQTTGDLYKMALSCLTSLNNLSINMLAIRSDKIMTSQNKQIVN
ncbi:hypothetical protein INT43_004280 [Umbelopsis isabellina]|uniref:Uncharacterized protein n=1 Tax=Mortierella isabellina TaxID=91625 RepID=A0A8H7PIM3_MORIS|nr:hypothetical protein INT43_004280 [Umbelopsis isabellina]